MRSALNAMILVMVVFIGIGLPLDRTATGFYYPTGTSNLTGDQAWLASGCNGNNSYFTGEYHIGHDFHANLNDPAYLIADGEVITISYNGWGTDNVGVVVRHKLSNQSYFLALYGHVRTSVAVGDKVYAGQSFATIGSWSSGTHLHFGIIPATTMPPSPWGRVLCVNWPSTNNFVDPINWLTAQAPYPNVGFFPDGWHADGTSQAILDRYNAAKAAGHDLGMAVNNHPNKDNGEGTAFAHETYGNIMQDFYGASNNYDHPHTAIICNVAKNQAHLLKDGFWDKYMNNNGLQNIKQPKNEEHNSNPTTQDFELVTLAWYGGNDVRIASSESNVSIAAFTPTHQITITSNPATAEIWNSGMSLGNSPVVGQFYQGYSYNMTAKLTGYQDKQFSFTVGSSDMTVNVDLVSGSGGVGPGAGSYSGNFPPSVPLTSPINTFPATLFTADFTPCYPLEGTETGIKLHANTPQTNSTKIFWIGNVGWWRVDLRLKSLRFIDDGINPQWPEVKLTITPHYGTRQIIGPFAIMNLGWTTYTVYAQMPSTGEHILELALSKFFD